MFDISFQQLVDSCIRAVLKIVRERSLSCETIGVPAIQSRLQTSPSDGIAITMIIPLNPTGQPNIEDLRGIGGSQGILITKVFLQTPTDHIDPDSARKGKICTLFSMHYLHPILLCKGMKEDLIKVLIILPKRLAEFRN